MEQEQNDSFLVLINEEGQYSLWPQHLDTPAGWSAVKGAEGTKADCMRYVDEHWTDMRPVSLREKMSGQRLQ